MHVFINPGTEPVEGNIENATIAMTRFVEALQLSGLVIEPVSDSERGGRFKFRLTNSENGKSCEVDMPGCDPDVTCAGKPWHSPRLYVDGSSWLFGIGLSIALSRLTDE